MNTAQLLPDVRALRRVAPHFQYDRKEGPGPFLARAEKEVAQHGDAFVRKRALSAIERLKGPSQDRNMRTPFFTAVRIVDASATRDLVDALDGPATPYDPTQLAKGAVPVLNELENELSVRGRALQLASSLFANDSGRSPIEDGTRIETYYNLHENTPSVRVDGRVRDASPAVAVEKPSFVVQPGGRQRVLREQSKNVHAFLRGAFRSKLDPQALEGLVPVRVKYDPYRFDSFVTADTEQPVKQAEYAAFMDNDGTTALVAWLKPEDRQALKTDDESVALFPSQVLSSSPEGPNAVTLTLKGAEGAPPPKPGQFVWIELAGLKRTPFAVSGARPGEIDVTVAAHGSTARALMDTPPGSALKVSAPEGTSFEVGDFDEGESQYLIAGGSGLAPLRSVVRASGGAQGLFVGFSKPEDVLFADGLEDLADEVHLAVRRPGSGTSKQPSALDVLKTADLDAEGRAFVVGPTGFMREAVRTLQERGFDPSRIFVSLHRYDAHGNVEGPVFPADHPTAREALRVA